MSENVTERKGWSDSCDASWIDEIRNHANIDQSARIQVLASTVGLQPITSAQAIAATNPETAFLFCSEETEENANEVKAWAVRMVKRKPTVHVVKISSALDTRELLRQMRESLQRSGAVTSRMCVDITGGRKAMSAVALLVAYQLGIQVIYSEEQRTDSSGGSEKPRYRVRPLQDLESLYLDQDFAVAGGLFQRAQFAAARDEFRRVGERASEARSEVQRAERLAAFYDAWLALNGEAALGKPTLEASDFGSVLTDPDSRQRFETHLRIAKSLRSKDWTALQAARSVTLFAASQAHLHANRYDLAALYAYRTVEHVASFSALHSLGLSPTSTSDVAWGNVKWEALKLNEEELVERYCRLSEEVSPGRKTSEKPSSLSRMTAMILAVVLNDHWNIDAEQLKAADKLLEARNKSYLAHGYETVDAALASSLLDVAEAWVDRTDWRSVLSLPASSELREVCKLPDAPSRVRVRERH